MAVRAKSIVPKVGEPDIDESYIRQQDAAKSRAGDCEQGELL